MPAKSRISRYVFQGTFIFSGPNMPIFGRTFAFEETP